MTIVRHGAAGRAVALLGFVVASTLLLTACKSTEANGVVGSSAAVPTAAGAAVPAKSDSANPASAPPLKDAFKHKFLIGTAVNYTAIQGQDQMSLALAEKHFSAFTPENSLKPNFTQPSEGKFTFDDGDKLVDIARQSGATVCGHCLIWHSQTPSWFFTGPDGQPVGRELALARMRKHIATVVGHFKGRIKEWDVVNEAINDGPEQDLRDSPWLKAIGPDYIAEAFRAAHAADPKAILIYNDYNIERSYKRPKALRLLKSLIDQHVPIDAVGMQCHWQLDSPDLSEVEDSIHQYAALGLKVVVSEMDVSVLPSNYQGADLGAMRRGGPVPPAMNPYVSGLADDASQKLAGRYKQAFAMFARNQKDILRVTIWGTSDANSWLNSFPIPGRTDYPLLFDRQGNPKPAFFAVRDAMAGK